MEPLGRAGHPSFYKGRSFLGELRKGEKLGRYRFKVGQLYSGQQEARQLVGIQDVSLPKPEIVLGVSGKDNRPKAIIRYIEGSGKKSEVRAPVPEKVINGQKVPA